MPQYLSDYLEESAARFPARSAVVDSGGGTATYAELNRQADALAAFLAARGVKRGDRVGVVLPKSIEAVVAIFGIMKAGAAYVPIDRTAPAERGRRILADCQVAALIVDGRSLDFLPEQSSNPILTIGVGSLPDSTRPHADLTPFSIALAARKDPGSHQRTSSDLAYIIYTSGSTGTPKGVPITHANALSFIDWCSSVLNPTEDDRFSSHTPFHFDASVQDIYPAIKHGATLCLISDDVGRAPRELARFVSEQRLTIWTSTPSALTMLVQFGNLDGSRCHLRIVSFGGEVFPVKHLRALKACWTSPVYYNMYGPTETTTTCMFGRIPDVIPDDREAPYPIGFPCSHCRALLLDTEGREPPGGKEGVLHISGPSVFAGYWDRPQETAAAFLERDGIRWYKTGDVARWDPSDGFTFIGRQDGMVKRRGFRIELGEIERALYLHPEVREAAVVSTPDEESGAKIVAFLSCDRRPSIIELKAFCATKVPTYMSPDRFVFVDRLPKTSTDKVDYQTLKGQLVSATLT